MSTSRKIEFSCPICHKLNVSETSHCVLFNSRWITLSCGHSYKEALQITEPKPEGIILADGKKLFPYQEDAVHFAERSGFNCLIADDTGLGKTIEATAIIHLHYDELKPILVVVKGSLTIQWQRHILSECGKFTQVLDKDTVPIPNLGIYIVSADMINKLADTIIKLKIKTMILDECQLFKNHEAQRTAGVRKVANARVKKTGVEEPIKLSNNLKRIVMIAEDLMKYHGVFDRFKFKIEPLTSTILGLCECKPSGDGRVIGNIYLQRHHAEFDPEDKVIETITHEIAHAITPGAGHKTIWAETDKAIGGTGEAYYWCEGTKPISHDDTVPMVKYKIPMSATPIHNNAIEYWPILNILRPEMFPNRNTWIKYDVAEIWDEAKKKYRPGGIKDIEGFKKKTKDFIIRRLKKDVLPDLPPVIRDFRYHEINPDETKAYNMGVKKLADFLNNTSESDRNFSRDLSSHMMVLRHIVGLAKINPIVEYIEEFFESEENGRKLVIFHHHVDVGDILGNKLKEKEIGYVRLISSMDSFKRQNLIDRFRKEGNLKVFIIPTLAGGVGVDLEFVQDAIVLEREWTPVAEEQAEGRFSRASLALSEEKINKINIVYPTVIDSVDEDFAKLVEMKRQALRESIDLAKDFKWDESQIMLEIAQITVKKWRNRK